MMEGQSLGNEQEKKKSVCFKYMKGMCVYGKSCRYHHPPKENSKTTTSDTKKSGMKTEVCSFYLLNKCKKGEKCQYIHIMPKATKLEQRRDWLTFCVLYPKGKCISKECRFLHVSKKDEDTFCVSGKISDCLLEQAMCKALLQDVSFHGNASVCKALLQGYCDVVSCPYLHLSRQAYTEAVSGALTEKFESIFGKCESIFKPQENYSLECAGASHQSDNRLCNVQDYGDKRYNSYKPSYNHSFACTDIRSNFDNEAYFASESNSLIHGMQNLMKDDVSLMRNDDKGQRYDLREKLNRIAAENARCNHGYSVQQPYENQRSAVCHISKEELKYQDMIRLLEKDNMEMRRKLAELEGQKLNAFSKGRLGSLYQRENLDKGKWQGVELEDHGYVFDTIGDEDDRRYSSNCDVAMEHKVSSYYPPRSKVNKKMPYHHNQAEKHQYHGKQYYKKTDQKYHQFNQQRYKEVKEDHKSASKGIQVQRKKHGETMTSDQVKYIKPSPRGKESRSESFNTSKNCDLEKSFRKGKKSVAPKKIHQSKLHEQNAKEIHTIDETNTENISEIEVVNEFLQKDEREEDRVDKDPRIDIENKETKHQDTLLQNIDSEEVCMEDTNPQRMIKQ